MRAKRCASAFRGDQSGYLAAGTVSHEPNFLAARPSKTASRSKMPGNWGMSVESPDIWRMSVNNLPCVTSFTFTGRAQCYFSAQKPRNVGNVGSKPLQSEGSPLKRGCHHARE